MVTGKQPDRLEPGARVEHNHEQLNKAWTDESLARKAAAEQRCSTHFKTWPPTALDAFRKQHGIRE